MTTAGGLVGVGVAVEVGVPDAVGVPVGVGVAVDSLVGVTVGVMSGAAVDVDVGSPPDGPVVGVTTVGSGAAPAGVCVVENTRGGAVGDPTEVVSDAVTPGAWVSDAGCVWTGADGSAKPGSVGVAVKVGRAAASSVSLLRTATLVPSVSSPESDEPHATTETQISQHITAKNGVFRMCRLLIAHRLWPEL